MPENESSEESERDDERKPLPLPKHRQRADQHRISGDYSSTEDENDVDANEKLAGGVFLTPTDGARQMALDGGQSGAASAAGTPSLEQNKLAAPLIPQLRTSAREIDVRGAAAGA